VLDGGAPEFGKGVVGQTETRRKARRGAETQNSPKNIYKFEITFCALAMIRNSPEQVELQIQSDS